LQLHRWLGRFYLLAVALGSIAGLAMAVVSEEGLPTPGLWDACSAVVFHAFQSVFADKTREHRGLVAAFGAESSPRGVHDPAEASTGTK